MEISTEQLIDELCELVAKETDYAELRRLIARLSECLDGRQKERNHARENSAPDEQSP